MNRIAIVTGAASGLGYEFAYLLAKDAYDLILIDIDECNLLKSKQRIVEKYSVNVDLLTCDLCTTNIAENIYEKVKGRNIEVLINNAGFGLFGFFTDTEWKVEESMILLHVLTLTHLTKLILKDMVRKGKGKILNVSSLAAFQPGGPLMSVYFATKAYILSFSEALANEVKGTGVTVTVLCPGQTKTNFENTAAKNSNSKVGKINRFTSDSAKVAHIGYHAMHSGRSSVVPGIVNSFIVLLIRIIPRFITVHLIRKIQVKIRR